MRVSKKNIKQCMDMFVFYAKFTMCLLYLHIKLNVDSDMYAMYMCLCSNVKLKKLKTQCVYMHIMTYTLCIFICTS